MPYNSFTKKLVSVGGGSLVVVIPRTWTRELGLDKGSMVELRWFTGDKILEVTPARESKELVQEITVSQA